MLKFYTFFLLSVSIRIDEKKIVRFRRIYYTVLKNVIIIYVFLSVLQNMKPAKKKYLVEITSLGLWKWKKYTRFKDKCSLIFLGEWLENRYVFSN